MEEGNRQQQKPGCGQGGAAHPTSRSAGGMLTMDHPGVELRSNFESISHRYRLFEVAFVSELTKETILGCLQGGPKPRGLQLNTGLASRCTRKGCGIARCTCGSTSLTARSSSSAAPKVTQGSTLSQSPTDATRSWWHLYGSRLKKPSIYP